MWSATDFDRHASRLIAERVREVLRDRPTCTLMLAGGRTPETLYPHLARSLAEWNRVALLFGDERCVPPDHVDSNYGMVRRALIANLPTAPLAVHRVAAENPDRDRAAREYASTFDDPVDVLLLGMGAEGHIASIFPGSTAIESDQRVIPVSVSATPPCRVTVTLRVITAARHVIMLVRGAAKAAALRYAMRIDTAINDCPAAAVRDRTWLLDQSAAFQLHQAE